jgi:dTDP-4-dehydrorhamnose reductase
MKILVTGANGQLGWELSRRGAGKGFHVLALDRAGLDITDPSAVTQTVRSSGAALVVNGAAYTAVDQAESEAELAFAANCDGPANLASACAEAGIPLIHISTDFVFDGEKKGPYRETDQVSPLNVYGKSKAAGETGVRERLQEHIILRTAWLYGVHGRNFVKTMLQLGQERDLIQVVVDQHGCPTYAADLAEAILRLVVKAREHGQLSWGTYHYCGKGITTWHGLAQETFYLAGRHTSLRVEKIKSISTAEYPTPAKRPANSVLDCSLIEKTFSIRPKPWQESLAQMIKVLFSVEKANNS